MMYALIEEGKVRQIIDFNPAGKFHPDFVFVKCDAKVSVDDSYEDGKFLPASAAVAPSAIACNPVQGLVALHTLKGKKEEDVLSLLASIEDPDEQYKAKIIYSKATEWRKGSPLVQTLAAGLQLTEQDLDELFDFAVTIVS